MCLTNRQRKKGLDDNANTHCFGNCDGAQAEITVLASLCDLIIVTLPFTYVINLFSILTGQSRCQNIYIKF